MISIYNQLTGTICSNDQIRITPSIRSQKGRIWSTHTMPNDNWEIEVTMRVNGRGRIGADGMALWYTDKVGTEGPVFGSNDNWNGLGIFLDSFDNDAQVNFTIFLMKKVLKFFLIKIAKNCQKIAKQSLYSYHDQRRYQDI